MMKGGDTPRSIIDPAFPKFDPNETAPPSCWPLVFWEDSSSPTVAIVIESASWQQASPMKDTDTQRRNAAVGWRDAIGFLALLSLALVPVIPGYGRLALGILFAGIGGLTIGRELLRSGAALIITGIALAVFGLPPPIGSWPLFFLLPITGVCLTAFIKHSSVTALLGIQAGAFGRRELAIAALFIVLSATALLIWASLVQPDLSRVDALIPDVSIALLIPVGLGFAVLNAVIEEVIWRGALLRWLQSIMSVHLAVVVQALSFGAAHWAGVPSGWAGVGLASIYGLMMGFLAVVARGLLAPIIAHIVADLVIFSLVLVLA